MHDPFAPVDDEGGLALPSSLLSRSICRASVVQNLSLVSRSKAVAASLKASNISELVELSAFTMTPFSCFDTFLRLLTLMSANSPMSRSPPAASVLTRRSELGTLSG